MTGYWHRWMVIWCWLNIAVGAVLAAASLPPLSAPARMFLDLVFWPLDGQPATLAPEAAFGLAICGAVMIGWGVLMLGLVQDRQLSREPRVWQAMTYGMVAWFVIDCMASLLTGAGMNVPGNIVFLATYLLPVLKSGVLSGQGLAIRPA